MLRRAMLLAGVVVMLGVSFGVAGDVKTKTWTVTNALVGDTVITTDIGVTGYRYFTLNIEWESGLDTANLNTHQWIVQSEADDGVLRWRNIYVDDTITVGDADSTKYPISLLWDGRDSVTLDRIRVRFESDVDGSGNGGEAPHDGATGVPVLKLHLTATKD